jgi:ElaB/YqjD/DUF883 family membrane-anchored ribosome-binding protein
MGKEDYMDFAESAAGTETGTEKVTKGKLMEDLKAVVTDLEGLLKVTASQTGEGISAARAKAEESLKSAKAQLAEEGKVALARAKAAAKSTDDYVHTHPWESVGIGAFVGFVLGVLISRR